MHFAAPFAFVPIPAGPAATLDCRLEGTTIQDSGTWLCCFAFCHTQQTTQVMHQLFKNACCQPALRLLIDCMPRRQVVGHHPPRRSGSYDVAQTVKHFAQRMLPLRCFFTHQGQIGCNQRPFFVTYVTWVCFSFHPFSILISSSS